MGGGVSGTYGKIFTRLWRDPEIRALSERATIVLLYLFTNEHRELSGVYYLPGVLAARELGKGFTEVEVLQVMAGPLGQWITFDGATDEVWVRSLAAVNLDHDRTLPLKKAEGEKKGDSRLKGLKQSLHKIQSRLLLNAWLDYYRAWDLGAPAPAGDKAPSAPLQGPVDAPPRPIAVALAGSSTNSSSVPSEPGEPDRKDKPLNAIIGAIRRWGYRDGKPPKPGDDHRDAAKAKQLLDSHPVDEILKAIEGARVLVDSGKLPPMKRGDAFTLRLLDSPWGNVTVFPLALDDYYAHAGDSSPARPGRGGMTSIDELVAVGDGFTDSAAEAHSR